MPNLFKGLSKFNFFANRQKEKEKWAEIYHTDVAYLEQISQECLKILIQSGKMSKSDVIRMQNKNLIQLARSKDGQHQAKKKLEESRTRLNQVKTEIEEINKQHQKLQIIFEGIPYHWSNKCVALFLSLIPGSNIAYLVWERSSFNLYVVGLIPTLIVYWLFEEFYRYFLTEDLLINLGLVHPRNRVEWLSHSLSFIFTKIKIYFGYLSIIFVDGVITFGAIYLRRQDAFQIVDYAWFGASILSNLMLLAYMYTKYAKGQWNVFRQKAKKEDDIKVIYNEYQTQKQELKFKTRKQFKLEKDVNQWSKIVSKLSENVISAYNALISESTIKRSSKFSLNEKFQSPFGKQSNLVPKEFEKVDTKINNVLNNNSEHKYDMG
jgi:hypothetical protein